MNRASLRKDPLLEDSLSEEPYLKPGERADYLWAIGGLGVFQMLVEWWDVGVQADDGTAVRMVVEKVVPR